MFEKLRNLGFAKQDLIIISFLLFSFLGGLVIKLADWKPSRDFDYSASDSEFESTVKRSFSSLESQKLSEQQQNIADKLNKSRDSLTASLEPLKLGSKETVLNKIININSASAQELKMLPGIGNAMAERIIEYRNSHKGFRRIDDIMEVKGIGEKKFEKLRPFISVK